MPGYCDTPGPGRYRQRGLFSRLSFLLTFADDRGFVVFFRSLGFLLYLGCRFCSGFFMVFFGGLSFLLCSWFGGCFFMVLMGCFGCRSFSRCSGCGAGGRGFSSLRSESGRRQTHSSANNQS
ncbi:hypothetical protein EBL_c22240 [Shimwellia blattae DSM 4481 = NBRC 105725]|uniref:Uncharacterized protein n=1 Tax=Shimwellia blattae (strain ATCC 29907 / DSM 4481 / JCM 1650 / NBRC 105725 / CDC 9005-74) TaxID=630626 RepID=I2B9W1_SHIBC|nr:hypothetical protein EBL_c22240 [Shimwellia blattae DSM 4481 = NBRC 105725]VDY64810.1 Uncharacterised protein [Shimwellia blattae]VEC22909.1 Uncharacterised protein [Shimwellia blattae]